MAGLALLENIVDEFPVQLKTPMKHFAQWTEEQFKIPREDFLRIEHTMERIAEAQEKTEQRLDRLTKAQEKTEQRLDRLADAQKKTEQSLDRLTKAQEKTDQRLDRLTERVDKLTQAQARTERSLSNQIAALGSRWGIYNEGTFRSTIQAIFAKMDGITVKEGYYGDRQVDVVIRNDDHIILEITSRMHARDIDKLYRSADDYYDREGVKPILMVATSYVSPKLMQKIMGLERPIEIFSYEGEEE